MQRTLAAKVEMATATSTMRHTRMITPGMEAPSTMPRMAPVLRLSEDETCGARVSEAIDVTVSL